MLDTDSNNTETARSVLDLILKSQDGILSKKHNSESASDRAEALDIVKAIAKHTLYPPAKQLLKDYNIDHDLPDDKEQQCFLCNGIFININEMIDRILETMAEYEFETFLIGTSLDPRLQDREDEFRAKYNISTGEAFKKNLNRVIGLKLDKVWKTKEVDFLRPDINLIIDLKPNRYKFQIQSNPLCVRGRYRKYERGIPQTHWPHRACRGKGCEDCNFTGKQYPTSVEEIIEPYILEASRGEKAVFHGAGREDIDAKCLGTGRPFVLEIKQPVKRYLDFEKIEKKIKKEQGQRVDAINLRRVDRDGIQKVKSVGEKTRKTYRAKVESEEAISSVDFNKLIPKLDEKLVNNTIMQRTPLRVVHRRADKTRKKRVYSFDAEWIDETHFEFTIEAMGGTYIKELISGDKNRTSPSISGFFNIPMVCTELDVMAIIDSVEVEDGDKKLDEEVKQAE
mgnify:FL=1